MKLIRIVKRKPGVFRGFAWQHSLSLLADTQPVLLDVLDMVTIDHEHYAGLLKLRTLQSSEKQGAL